MEQVLCVLVSFFASVVGCICGIGGGVIIKPVLDAMGTYSIGTIRFMSGGIVLAMTACSVLKNTLARDCDIEKGVSTWLGLGAALGGAAGKQGFDLLGGGKLVGAVQAAMLFAVTLAAAVYTLERSKLKPRRVQSPLGCAVIGLCLGILSAFLGIGGGPINLVVLHHFFAMETKRAAQNSLYVILLSQLASLLLTIATGSVPEFPPVLFTCMVGGGVLGSMTGRAVNRRIADRTVDRLFLGLLAVLMGICAYNFLRFSGGL
ncbi:sulfite exporter TauE/SafE family protein [uncultured Oscillibacter sp.]|uniref:sulfite exporter TauE/SafE family protein n=1 Tax=uncultured Oscillibacter sp. TaxID=876091 RepID=UPI0028065765|nr:sulfite exporter TauE/SafE family protein [uncultured Oscillibacter sp.]